MRLVGFILWFALVCLPASAEFGFEEVRMMVEKMATQPFKSDSNHVPETFLKFNFDQYSKIRFIDQKALWHDERLPFQLEFFPAGYTHKQVVQLQVIDETGVRDVAFDPSLFKSPPNQAGLSTNLGYAGFRINQPGTNFIELAAFLDGTYFRMLGRDQDYGTSARGLALNTVGAEPEEFPEFQQFWIRKPHINDREITIYALMDSPSVAGAYRFVIRPGIETTASIKAALYPRRAIKEFGIAPLTSMFLYGKNGHAPLVDFRPEVHDSDGLLMENGRGEWIWRPLDAGKMTRIDAFQDEAPRGFGLMQRERNFEDYQDLVERYQRRPSVWVQPVGNWGKGAIELVELASDQESFDNTTAYWIPAIPPEAGRRLDVEYVLHWTTNHPSPSDLGRVQATRISRIPGQPNHLRFVIEFDGKAVESLAAAENLSPQVDYGAGAQPVTSAVYKNEFDQSWRLVIEIVEPAKVLNLHGYLKHQKHAITEIWNYTWQP